MPTTLNKNLLDGEGEAAPKSHRRIVVASATTAVLLLSAGFVGYSVGKSSVKMDKFAAVNAPMSGNYTNLGEILETKCYRYLGIKCKGNNDKACSDYGAQCDGSECVCPNGGCAGGDGSCSNEHNKKLNKKPISITNFNWPGWYMYKPMASMRGQFRISRWFFTLVDHGYNFDLYKLPGGSSDGHNLYYLTLADEGYTTWVAAMQQNPGGGVDQADYGLYGVDLSAESDKPHKNPVSLAVRLCNMASLHRDWKAIRIGFTSADGHDVWAYGSDSSVLPLVSGWDEIKKEQGAGSPGMWILSDDSIRAGLEGCSA